MKKEMPYILRLFIFSFIYFIFGKLCLELAIPVGVASPIWPSAGIAVAVLIRYGIKYFPGAFIGSYCASIGLLLFINQSQPLINSIIVVAVIALAGTIHAIVAAMFVKKFIGNGSKIISDTSSLFKLFIIAILPAGVLSSLIGTLGLYFADIVPKENFGFSMFNWWLGDSIGVVSFTPLCLFLFYEKREKRMKSLFMVALPLVISITLVGNLFYYLDKNDQNVIHSELKKDAEILFKSFEAKFNDYAYVLDATNGFYAASKFVERKEFKAFLKPFFKNYEAIQAISWIPKVSSSEVEKYVNLAKADGFENFKFKESSDKGMVPITKRDFYYPVYYLEPLKNNEKALGYDLASNPFQKKTLLRSLELYQKQMTESLELIQGDKGILIVDPIFNNNKHVGYISLVVKIKSMIESLLKMVKSSNNQILIYEVNDDYSKEVLYNSFTSLNDTKEILNHDNLEKRGFSSTHEIDLMGRKWGIIQFISNEFIVSNKPLTSWIILVIGFLLSGLLTTLFILESGRTKKIEELVLDRTIELQKAQSAMIQSSKFAALGEMAGGIAHEINNPLAIIQGYAERMVFLASEKQIDENEVKIMSQKICKTNLRISTIISGLRSFAREESQHDKENILYSQIITDSLALCQEKFKAHGVTVSKLNILENLKIYCHPTQISQVILNLLNNSFDQIKNSDDNRWIEIEMFRDDENVKLVITDSGLGINKDIVDKIMEPFFTTKPYGHGTGLGLSISKGIVESHGGDLFYDIDYKNTRFILSLKKSS